MKAIIKKTGKVGTVVGFHDNGRIELKNGATYRPSELIIDYHKNNRHPVLININSLIGKAVMIGGEADLEELKQKLKSLIKEVEEDSENVFID